MSKELEKGPLEYFHFLSAAAVVEGACQIRDDPEDPPNQHQGPQASFRPRLESLRQL